MTKTVKSLLARVTNSKGVRILGALSRVAEYLGVRHSTVANWLNDKVDPEPETSAAILRMLKDRNFSVTARKTGVPKGQRTWAFDKNRVHVYAEK